MNIELEQEIIDLYHIENKKEKKDKILDIIKKVDRIDDVENHEKYYLKGYLWYLIPFDSETRNKEIVTNLKKSLLVNKEYLFAKAYLGYFFFDQKQYQKVIETLDDLDFSYFEERDQLWRSLKLQELLCVSKLNLKKEISNSLYDKILNLIFLYSSVPEEEIVIPNELIESVLNNSHKEGAFKLVNQIDTLINSENQKDYFDDEVKKEVKRKLKK